MKTRDFRQSVVKLFSHTSHNSDLKKVLVEAQMCHGSEVGIKALTIVMVYTGLN